MGTTWYYDEITDQIINLGGPRLKVSLKVMEKQADFEEGCDGDGRNGTIIR
jgi:hypothetical protein